MSSTVSGGGVRSQADLMQRCVVDEHTECWRWKFGRDGGGRPNMWIPAIRAVGTIGVACAVFATGKRPEPGTAWHPTCGTSNCANPEHRICGTRKSQMRALKMVRTPLQIARITRGKRAASKLSQDDVLAIRRSQLTLKQIAQQYGINAGYACQVRNGTRRGELAAPGSSVFAWSPER